MISDDDDDDNNNDDDNDKGPKAETKGRICRGFPPAF